MRKTIRQANQRAGLPYTRSHLPRHTTAIHLLQSGVPFNVIALWLGHEGTTTTARYVEANLAINEKALPRLEAETSRSRRKRSLLGRLPFSGRARSENIRQRLSGRTPTATALAGAGAPGGLTLRAAIPFEDFAARFSFHFALASDSVPAYFVRGARLIAGSLGRRVGNRMRWRSRQAPVSVRRA